MRTSLFTFTELVIAKTSFPRLAYCCWRYRRKHKDGTGEATPSSLPSCHHNNQQQKQHIMENSFIPDAIEIVSKAIAADNENEYEKALALYRDALARFTMGLKYEKNEARKKLILERVEGYMKRAEE